MHCSETLYCSIILYVIFIINTVGKKTLLYSVDPEVDAVISGVYCKVPVEVPHLVHVSLA